MQIETVEALKAAAEKATQGCRVLIENPTNSSIATAAYENGGKQIAFVSGKSEHSRANAKFLALVSPETILELLSTLSATQRELEQAKAEIGDRKAAAKYSRDVDDELAHELGVPLCESHQKYCAPHVANWLIENKKRTEAELSTTQRERDELKESLKHFEDSPFGHRVLFENDGNLETKNYDDLSDEDFAGLMEYSESCKCQGCYEVGYILRMRKELALLKANDTHEIIRGVAERYKKRMEDAEELALTLKARESAALDAISWACGANGDFEKPENSTRYWWRSELTRLAGIKWDGTKYAYIAPIASEETKNV